MEIKFFKATWGMEAIPTLDERLGMIADAGYDGIEINVTGEIPAELPDLLDKYNLEWVAQLIYDRADDLVEAMEKIAPHKPVLFGVHPGRDNYSFDEGGAFFEKALEAENRLGIPVAHETHRHRLFYSPFVTREYLNRFPDLRINADFSHWTCVCESLLEDIDDTIELAISRAIHIHARVGHPEGPQVSDPRDPDFARHQELFQGWWDRIRAAREKAGAASLIVVPEYGPPGYMQTLPFTKQPVTDLWEICLWQANAVRRHWSLPVPGEE